MDKSEKKDIFRDNVRMLIDSSYGGSVVKAAKDLGIQRRRMYRYYTEGISSMTHQSRAGVAKIAEMLKLADLDSLWTARVGGSSDHDEFCPHCGQRMPRKKEGGAGPALESSPLASPDEGLPQGTTSSEDRPLAATPPIQETPTPVAPLRAAVRSVDDRFADYMLGLKRRRPDLAKAALTDQKLSEALRSEAASVTDDKSIDELAEWWVKDEVMEDLDGAMND